MKAKIFFFLLLFPVVIFSQDMIIKLDSSKIYCRITKEDSLSIYYIPAKEKATETSIAKSLVLKYYSSVARAKAQQVKIDTTKKIYSAKTLTKGVYTSYSEYIHNSPAYLKDVVAVERGQAELIFSHGSQYAYSVNGTTVITSSNYGFCDGKDAYVNYDHPKGFCKIECIGPYSFFTYVVHGAGAFALIPDQLMLIDPSGEFITATPKKVRKILAKEWPELAVKYEAEPDQHDKRKEYILKLNEYLVNKK